MLIQDRNRDDSETRAIQLAQDAFRFTSRNEAGQVSIGCGEAVNTVDRLERSYRGARNAVEYARLLGLSHILSVQDIRSRDLISPEQFNAFCSRIIERLKEGGLESSLEALEALLDYLASHYLTSDQLVIGFMHFYQMLDAFARDMDLQPDTPYSLMNRNEDFESLEKAAPPPPPPPPPVFQESDYRTG